MQQGFARLAYTPATARIMTVMTPHGVPRNLKALVGKALHYAALDLPPTDQRALYGARWSRLHERPVRLTAGLLFALLRLKRPPSPQLWAQAPAQVQVHAFGARAAKLTVPPALAPAPGLPPERKPPASAPEKAPFLPSRAAGIATVARQPTEGTDAPPTEAVQDKRRATKAARDQAAA